MKKKLLITMALTLMMGTGAAFAASNPFVDLPANHWSYKSVSDLAKAGLVDGYGDGTFKGDRTMTRYEMAQIVAKATARADKEDADQRAQLEKLQTEFAAELQNLGVKLDNLKTQVDNMPKFGGEVRVRYEKGDLDGKTFAERTRITMSGNINDNWTYHGRFENTQHLDTNNDTNGVNYNLAYIQGKVGEMIIKGGRFDYMPVYGLMADSAIKGLYVGGGKDFTYGFYYGKADNQVKYPLYAGEETISGVEVGGTLDNKVNLKAGYFHRQRENNLPANNVFEIGANTTFGDFGLTAAYAKSSLDVKDQDKSYKIGLNYNADKTKPGAFGADVSYQRNGAAVNLDSTLDVTNGYKGYKVGAEYTVDKNMVLKASYIDQKEIASGQKDKITRGELFFYF